MEGGTESVPSTGVAKFPRWHRREQSRNTKGDAVPRNGFLTVRFDDDDAAHEYSFCFVAEG